MKLSHRLQRLHHYYDLSPHLWDIGCDHGLLGLSFIDRPEVLEIHLVDPSLPVMEVLKKKIKDSYITKRHKIILHQSKGQDLRPTFENKKCLFIAGMGGQEIIRILTTLTPHLSPLDTLILSPHRKVLELRAALIQLRFGILGEEVIQEGEQFYQIMALRAEPSLPQVDPFGGPLWKGPEAKVYREHQVKVFQRHQDPLSLAYVRYLNCLSL